jgi:predicted RNA-binding Zn ribbon-like protein
MSWQFDRCGGHLALDFANTVSSRHTSAPIERLPSYDQLVEFGVQAELITARRAAELRARGLRDPDAAEAVLTRAVSLREALYHLFAAVAGDRAPRAPDVARLDAELPRLHLGDDLAWTWRDDVDTLDPFLGAVVQAAVELATSPSLRSHVRICEAPDCIWLFFDTSRNHSRRWCDMKQCGNRMKARRHYQRARDA